MKHLKPWPAFLIGMVTGGILCSLAGLMIIGSMVLFRTATNATQSVAIQQATEPPPFATPTPPVVGIGTPVACDGFWRITVLGPPEFRESYRAGVKKLAMGIFYKDRKGEYWARTCCI